MSFWAIQAEWPKTTQGGLGAADDLDGGPDRVRFLLVGRVLLVAPLGVAVGVAARP